MANDGRLYRLCARVAACLLRGRRGQAIAVAALGVTGLLSMAGVVIDVGVAYVEYRQAQSAADAAALAAADDLPGPYAPLVAYQTALASSDARGVAATGNLPANGFSDGANSTTVTVTAPYNSGPATCTAAVNSCAQVTISRDVPTHFLAILGRDHITVSRTGVAAVQMVAGYPCTICVLDPLAAGALNNTGGAAVSVSNGDVVVNSTSSTAITLGSNATVNASGGSVGVVGNWNGKGTVSPAPTTNAPPAPDPLAQLAYPDLSYATCPNVTASGQTNTIIAPGCYNNLSVTGNGALVLLPGLYVITGQVKNTGNGSGGIQGTGVTLFVTCGGNKPAACANGGESGGAINIGGNGSVNLTAPTGGTYQGVTIFYDRNNTAGLSIVGNGSQLSGTVYAKSSTFTITGNSGNMADNSLIVVDQMFFNGNTGLTDSFTPDANYPHPQKLGPAKLVQ